MGLAGRDWGQMGEAGSEAAEVGRGQIWKSLKDLERSLQLVLGALKNFTQGVTRTELWLWVWGSEPAGRQW